MKRLWTSLRFRLVLLVVFATIPAVALILYGGFEARHHEVQKAQDEALQLARIASTQHQHVIEETQRILAGLAQVPAIRDGDAAACTPILQDLLKTYSKLYTNLTVVDTNGDLVCSGTPVASGANVSVADRKYFQQALATGKFSFGDYVIGRISGKAALLTGLPVLDARGAVLRVIHAGIDLTWLNEFAESVHLPGGSRLAVADRSGTLLIRYPNPEQWVGRKLGDSGLVTPRVVRGEREGFGEGTGAEGVPRIYGFTVLGSGNAPEDEVVVSVALPSALAYAEANARQQRSLIGLGIAAALALAAAWLGSDLFLLKGVQSLVTVSRRVAAGDFSVRSGLHDSGELGQLGRAFDDMASALQQRSAERQRAEQERSQLLEAIDRERATLASILASMSQGVIVVEPNEHIGYCSTRAGALLGLRPESIIGRPVDEVLAEVRRTWRLTDEALPDWPRLRTTQPAGAAFELNLPGPPPRDLSIDVFVIAGERTASGFGMLIRDVTAERNATRTKDSVLATVSHELRTPLSSIRSYSEILLEYDDDPVARREFLEIINAESERLTRLLNEVLDLTTIESGKVVWNVGTFDLGPLIADSIRVYTPLARDHLLELSADVEPDLPRVSTDADRLRQVINNLIDNAIKFTDKGSIRVSARRIDGEVRIAVRDSGVGIPPEDLDKIFERFHQGGTVTTGKPRGIGLGLSICREIVRRSGGRIWAESAPGGGSTFIVALPAAAPAAPAREPRPEAVASAG